MNPQPSNRLATRPANPMKSYLCLPLLASAAVGALLALAQPAQAQSYTFQVQQTYSDGSIVNWSGPESSDSPAPTIKAVSSIGGGGNSTLTIIALIIGVLGLLAGGFAVISGAGSGEKKRALA